MSRTSWTPTVAALLTAVVLNAGCNEARKPAAGAARSSTQAAKTDKHEAYRKQVLSIGPLTHDLVKRYIRTVRLLRILGVGLPGALAGGGDVAALKPRIEDAAGKNGFASYAEFVKVNARIAWAWRFSAGRIGLARRERQQQQWVSPLTSGQDAELLLRYEDALLAMYSRLNAAQLEAVKQATLRQLDGLKGT